MRGTTARMRRVSEATWQGRRWPTRGAGGAQEVDTWQEVTRVHGSTRMPVCDATWQERVGIWRAHGLVGPSKMIGAVCNSVKLPRYLYLTFFKISSVWDYVPHISYLMQATWTHSGRRIQSGWRRSRGPASTRSSNQHVRLNQV